MTGIRLGVWDRVWRGVLEDVWLLKGGDRSDINLHDGVNKNDAGTEALVWNLFSAGLMSNIGRC